MHIYCRFTIYTRKGLLDNNKYFSRGFPVLDFMDFSGLLLSEYIFPVFVFVLASTP
jgi:hypothetical protein